MTDTITSLPVPAWCYRASLAGAVANYESRDVRIFNPGWNDENFRRPITSLEFGLPTGHRIILAGYEAYNLFLEVSQSLGGGGKTRLEAIYLAGRTGQTVDLWKIAEGRIFRDQRKNGKEYGGGATRGWKQGLRRRKPRAEIVKQ